MNASTWPSYKNSRSIQFSIQKLKLPVAYLVKQLSIINGTHKFITVFTGSSPMIRIMSHTNPPHHTNHISWTLPALFPPRGDFLPLRRSRYNLVSIRTTCRTYLPHFNTRQKVQLWSSSLCNVRHPPVSFSQTVRSAILMYVPCTVHNLLFRPTNTQYINSNVYSTKYSDKFLCIYIIFRESFNFINFTDFVTLAI